MLNFDQPIALRLAPHAEHHACVWVVEHCQRATPGLSYGGQNYLLPAMDMVKVGGPLSVVKVFALIWHPKSTAYYFSIPIILSVTHMLLSACCWVRTLDIPASLCVKLVILEGAFWSIPLGNWYREVLIHAWVHGHQSCISWGAHHPNMVTWFLLSRPRTRTETRHFV